MIKESWKTTIQRMRSMKKIRHIKLYTGKESNWIDLIETKGQGSGFHFVQLETAGNGKNVFTNFIQIYLMPITVNLMESNNHNLKNCILLKRKVSYYCFSLFLGNSVSKSTSKSFSLHIFLKT